MVYHIGRRIERLPLEHVASCGIRVRLEFTCVGIKVSSRNCHRVNWAGSVRRIVKA
jgi:hypothetical protein